MTKLKKNASKDGANKKAHNASNNQAGGGGKVRRHNEMANKSPPPANGMMQCYANALHTNSVTLRHISFVESVLDKHINEEPGSKEFLKVKKGKLKKLRKQTKTVVITTTNIGDIKEQSQHGFASVGGDTATIQAIYVKPLLVLDLNGILCRRIRFNKLPVKEGERINFRPAVGHIAGTPVVAREDLQPMLSYLDANFTLAVWTSAKLATARGLISMLFPPDIASRLLFVWGQDRCDATKPNDAVEGKNGDSIAEDNASDEPDGGGDFKGKSNQKDSFDIIFEKSLGKVWANFQLWDSTNTLLIDDSPEKARKWIENTLHPPPIDGIAASEPGAESADLSNAIKQRIFFEKLVEHFGNHKMGDNTMNGGIELPCSNIAVESIDEKKERKKRECRKLHSVLANDDHMGWRGSIC